MKIVLDLYLIKRHKIYHGMTVDKVYKKNSGLITHCLEKLLDANLLQFQVI